MGAWIEITFSCFALGSHWVAPLVGAWIEIFVERVFHKVCESLPSWERGLKSEEERRTGMEILVAPLVGAWIEIKEFEEWYNEEWSLPSRERGLK